MKVARLIYHGLATIGALMVAFMAIGAVLELRDKIYKTGYEAGLRQPRKVA